MSNTIALFESELHEFALVEGIHDGEKHFYIRGKFATIERLNNNRRVYPRALWEREVAKYQSEIENGTINTLMEWEHPKGRLTVDPKNAVAKITKLWIEGDYVMGEAVIFDTPQSETLKSMIRHGVKISVSSRASGNVGAGGIVKEFNLITFDIVTNPSDQSATMSGVLESEEFIDEETKMADEALMENLVGILRSKNVEIQDLNEEIDILRGQLQALTIGVGDTDRPYRDEGARGQKPVDDVPNRYTEEDAEFTMRRHGVPTDEDRFHRHQDVSSTLRDTDPSGRYKSGEDEEPVIPTFFGVVNRAEFVGTTLDRDLAGDEELNGYSGFIGSEPKFADYGKMHESIADVEVTETKKLNESIKGNRFLKVPSHLI